MHEHAPITEIEKTALAPGATDAEQAHDAELSRMVECLQIMNSPVAVVEVSNDSR